MTTDTYTKMVLTVIAACLLWLCAMTGAPSLRAQRRAQELVADGVQPVVIVGWGMIEASGRVVLTMNNRATDPNIPVKVIGYPMPPKPVDVRLDYTEDRPMPVGISTIKPAGPWEPIRTAPEGEPTRPRPGR